MSMLMFNNFILDREEKGSSVQKFASSISFLLHTLANVTSDICIHQVIHAQKSNSQIII